MPRNFDLVESALTDSLPQDEVADPFSFLLAGRQVQRHDLNDYNKFNFKCCSDIPRTRNSSAPSIKTE